MEPLLTFPAITTGLCACLLILQQSLLLNVGMHRGATGVGVGSNGDEHLERKARRHANLAENSAIFVLGLAFLEMSSVSWAIIMAFAIVFGASRLFHAIAFMSLTGSHRPLPGNPFVVARMIGAFGTALSGLGVGGLLLFNLLTAI